jgi:long-chain acyl-CoA synthetase
MGEVEKASREGIARPWLHAYPKGLDWGMAIDARPLFSLLDEAVARDPDHPFLEFLGKRYRYRDVDDLAARAVSGLQRLGVGKGAKVGLFLPNCPYYAIAFFAILKAGATVVNYNPLAAEEEILRQIEDSGTEVLITLDLTALYGKVASVLRSGRLRAVIVCAMADVLPFPRSLLFRLSGGRQRARIPHGGAHMWFDRLVANDGRYERIEIDPAVDIAALQYTGGTTGIPKGVCLTHANLYVNAIQISRWFTGARFGAERIFALLPFFHAFGMTAVMNLAVALGGELIVVPRFDVRQVLKSIQRTKATLFVGVPTIFRAIVDHPDVGRHDLSSLRVCVSGGDALPSDIQTQFEALTGCRLTEGYGLTECAPVVACNPFEGVRKRGSVGLPLPGTSVRVVSPLDGRAPCPAGERGEICVSGPQVMAGYWRNPAETAATLVNGWLHTGDMGYLDEDGYLYVVERLKDVIIVGGYNVYPAQVEKAIKLHPRVADAAVVGQSDRYWGQVVTAHIVPVPGAEIHQREVLEFLADKLSPIEMPKQITFADRLPKSLIGKTLRNRLLPRSGAEV